MPSTWAEMRNPRSRSADLPEAGVNPQPPITIGRTPQVFPCSSHCGTSMRAALMRHWGASVEPILRLRPGPAVRLAVNPRRLHFFELQSGLALRGGHRTLPD